MTPEQQRDALKHIFRKRLEGERWLFNDQWIYFDPLNDANAMRAVVMGLHHKEKIKIPDALELVMLGKGERPRLKIDIFYLISADPKYLAQAVLDVMPPVITEEQFAESKKQAAACSVMLGLKRSDTLEEMGWIGGPVK